METICFILGKCVVQVTIYARLRQIASNVRVLWVLQHGQRVLRLSLTLRLIASKFVTVVLAVNSMGFKIGKYDMFCEFVWYLSVNQERFCDSNNDSALYQYLYFKTILWFRLIKDLLGSHALWIVLNSRVRVISLCCLCFWTALWFIITYRWTII